MSSKKLIIIVMAVLVTGLSSCVKNEPNPETKLTPVTEKLIREKILKVLEVDGVTVLQKDFSIESNTVTEDKDTIVVRVVIVKGLSTSTLKVTLHYLAMVNNYIYTGSEVEEISTVTAEGPSLEDAYNGSKLAMIDQTTYTSIYMPVMSFPVGEVKCLRSEPLPVTGSFYMTCSSSYKMLETTAVGTAIVKANYTFNKGWAYKVESWSLVATTKLANTFDFVFQNEFRNEDTWFVPGQVLKVNLNGTMTMIFRSDSSITVDNKMTGSMTTKGKTAALTITPSKETDYLGMVSPDSLKLSFGPQDDAYILLGTSDGMGACGAPFPPSWNGIDADKNYFNIAHITKSVSAFMC
jgi:hypothetical protein